METLEEDDNHIIISLNKDRKHGRTKQ